METGEIEYPDRIDLQVKIRGHRIEQAGDQSALRRAPDVTAAVVDTFEPTPGSTELSVYYFLRIVPPDPLPAHFPPSRAPATDFGCSGADRACLPASRFLHRRSRLVVAIDGALGVWPALEQRFDRSALRLDRLAS